MTSPTPCRHLGRLAAALFAALLIAAAPARATDIDPTATDALQRMSNYLGGLQQFSVHTQADVEVLHGSDQRIDYAISAQLAVSRPDKLRSERNGDPVDQVFYYNGKQLTLYDRSHKVYASVDAPDTLEQMLGYAQNSLGLVLVGSDLIYHDAYPLLMDGVTSATVIGKSVIDGVSCDHLAFRRPGVDFQIWIADSGTPLPYKYIVTDTGTPALLSVSLVMSDWSASPKLPASSFDFTPPSGVQQVPFLRIDSDTGLGH